MTEIVATLAGEERFILGEGPVWDAPRQRLLWVDCVAGALYQGRLHDERITVTARQDFGEMIGAVDVAADGSLVVAAQERLVVLAPDGARRDGPRIVPAGERRRLNDGASDPAGRFVVGTLSLDGESEREVLVRWEPDGQLTELDGDLSLSNGLAWSTDAQRMYSADSLHRRVYVRDYDAATGATGPRRTHLSFHDGLPDGIAMDAEDHLWVAVWGAGQARRYAPDGTCVARISVPAPHISCVAFAGPDRRQLIITTATDELTDAQLAAFPDSGRTFIAHVPTPGWPPTPWRGMAAP